jgi:hypothetical protein
MLPATEPSTTSANTGGLSSPAKTPSPRSWTGCGCAARGRTRWDPRGWRRSDPRRPARCKLTGWALEARGVLPDGLRALGAIVDVIPVYRIEVEHAQDRAARRRLQAGEADVLTFTSPSTARNFVAVLGAQAANVAGRSLVACIGPVTAAAARDCGLTVGLVAERYTIPGLVAALRGRLGRAAPAQDRQEDLTP